MGTTEHGAAAVPDPTVAEGVANPPIPEPGAPSEGSLSERFGRLIDRTRNALEKRRPSSRIVDVGLFAVERNRVIPATLMAAALASRIIIFSIPFIVLVVVATGFYSDLNNASAADVARDAGMPGLMAEAVGDSAEARQGFRIATLIIVTFTVLWAAYSVARLMRRITGLLWTVPAQPPRRRWAPPFVVLIVASCGLLVSHLGLRAGDWSVRRMVLVALVELIVITIGWTILTRLLPHDPNAHGWLHHLPGAFLIAIGIAGVKLATLIYLVPHAETLNERYGDVAAVVLMMTWAYWIAYVIVFGTELNVALFRSYQRRHTMP